jgi:hypothetical protein
LVSEPSIVFRGAALAREDGRRGHDPAGAEIFVRDGCEGSDDL